MRHSLARWEELPRTEPTTTSPTSVASRPVAATVALRRVARRSSLRGVQTALLGARDGGAQRAHNDDVVGGLTLEGEGKE